MRKAGTPSSPVVILGLGKFLMLMLLKFNLFVTISDTLPSSR